MDWRGPLARLHLDELRGGMTIDTPKGSKQPLLRTVIQFDGDILNFVACDAAGRLPPADALNAAFAAHRAALAKQIDMVAAWRIWWGRAGKVLLASCGAAASLTGADWAVWHSVIAALGPFAITLVPAGLGYGARRGTGLLLRAAMSMAAWEQKRQTRQVYEALKQKRSGGRTPIDVARPRAL